MNAMVFTAPGTVEVIDVDRPVAHEDEVVIDVAACGICGSELHGIDSPGLRKPPLIMGHEFSGTDPSGRAVVVNPIISCGACDLCVAGRAEVCRQRVIIGVHRPGGFAEQVAVPKSAVFDLPGTVPLRRGALVEPIANGLHAWRLGGAGPGCRVGIIGAGAIGIATLLVSKHFGASAVVADLSEQRLALAERLGADGVGTCLGGEFDVTVDAVGATTSRAASLGCLRPTGVAVWIGLHEVDARFDAVDLVRTERRIVGSFAYAPEEFEEAVDIAAQVPLDWAEELPLKQGPGLFYELKAGRVDVLKVLLCPGTSPT